MDLTKLPPGAGIAYQNGQYLTVIQWPFARLDGTAGIQSRVIVRNGVAVVALNADTHQVYMVRVVRHRLEGNIIPLELPGGGIDDGSTPLETARRELLEETGVVAVNDDEDWIPLFRPNGMNPVDGLVLNEQHAFLLLRGRKVLSPVGDETKQVTTMPLSRLIELDDDNGFNDPLTPYKLRRAEAWLRRHRPDLLT